MSEHRYILEPYKGLKTRYTCPNCGKVKKFARYIDTETNCHLGDKVGKCERSDNCGYHYTPKQYFTDNGITPDHNTEVAAVKDRDPEKPASYIDEKLQLRTLADYDHNNFVKYLRTLFDQETVSGLIEKYKIGTSKHWPGSTVFWQIDISGKIRTGKIMQYDASTGKRIKVPHDRIHWVHSLTKQKDFNLKQCLFGEHLLFSSKLPIACVESEKTAIIASAYLPHFTWVASGNKLGLSVDKCNTLKSHVVCLYPDLNAFKEWNEKAQRYKFKISDLLEKKATDEERAKGLDLADYLIRFDIKDFLTVQQPASDTPPMLANVNIQKYNLKPEVIIPIDKNLREPEALQNSHSTPDLIELRQYYQDLEDNGLIPDHHRSYIGTLWQGVMIYKHHPPSLKLYTDPLHEIKAEIESLNKQKIAI